MIRYVVQYRSIYEPLLWATTEQFDGEHAEQQAERSLKRSLRHHDRYDWRILRLEIRETVHKEVKATAP